MKRLPFVDTHVHYWNLKHPDLRWVWLDRDWVHPLLGDIDALKSIRYAAEEFIAETRFQNVSKTVHVQAALGSPDPVVETEWLEAMADRTGFPNGIVAEAWLARPDVEAQLERHAAFPRVRGIRDFGEGEYLEDPAWQRGYALLAKHGLICCLDSDPSRYARAHALAERHPGVVLCIDHCGVPQQRDAEYFAFWQAELRKLAAADNVIVKVSGLPMCDHRWTVESLRPWVLECVESFGVGRVVLGTNWPVDSLYSSYGDVVDAYAQILAELAPHEQQALFSDNAERIFRI
jgi:predicted TIM-barrel fold metal-dependent hydrolase